MTRTFLFLAAIGCCFTLQSHRPFATWNYNGGSGTQIVVTYDGSMLQVGQHPYNLPLRVTWSTPNGPYNELVYSSFYPYNTYSFTISGSYTGSEPPPSCPSCPPPTTSSVSYYVYY